MPADCGRDVVKLVEVSRRSGIHVVAPTGLHHERFYDARHWSIRASAEEIAALFIADIEDGIDAEDYGGPIVRRTSHRAGVIKVGGSADFPTDRDRRVFTAAAIAQRETGCPILTHCEGGARGVEQMRLLVEAGADPAHVVLSHVDKVVDRGYHRELAAIGASLEYDGAFRWKDEPNGTLQLLGMDGRGRPARPCRCSASTRRAAAIGRSYGGSPGMTYLLDGFDREMRAIGLGNADLRTMFVMNPAASFSFIDRGASSHDGQG